MTRIMTLIACFIGNSAIAEVPKVVVDIPPVHSLVAQVMDGMGAPTLVTPAGTNPHHHSLRPSQARNLSQADIVIWVGEGLTPWLGGAIGSLAPNATSLELLELNGLQVLPFREQTFAQAETHGHDDHHDEHGDEDHDDHGDEHGHEGHDHGAFDPHAWLDPQIATRWVVAITAALSAEDPDNSAAYMRNAQVAILELKGLQSTLESRLETHAATRFITLHDAYQYYEARFNLSNDGTVSNSDAAKPSAARVAALRARVEAEGVRCLFVEPFLDQSLARTLAEDLGLYVDVLDPLGTKIALGASHYGETLNAMADAFDRCAAAQ